MKIKAIIASIALASMGTGALTVGLVNSSNSKQAKADVVASGVTYLSLFQSQNEWASDGAKFAFYYYNQTDYNPKREGWSTSFATLVDAESYVYSASYSLDFTPNMMIAVRFNASSTSPAWDNGNINQTQDLGLHDVACVYQWSDSSAWTDDLATIKGLASDLVLNSYKESSVDGNHGESYKTGVALQAGDKFTVSHQSNTYYGLRTQSSISANFKVNGTQIECLVSGTYDLFFNTSGDHMYSKQLWIETSAANAAAAFANNFLTNFTCGGTTGEHAGTVTAAEGTWGNLKSAWNLLTDGSKSYFLNATPSESGDVYAQVMARYKYVIEKYGTSTYEDFMGKGYKAPNESNLMKSVSDNNSGVAIVIVSSTVVVVSLVATVLFLKKRKEN